MKKRVFLLSLVLTSLMYGDDTDLLSQEKKSLLLQQQNIIESENEKLRTNWIAPLNLLGNYSHDKSAAGNFHTNTETVSASISQDIFRSGGITYQIDYADTKKQGDSLLLDQQIASLNSAFVTTFLSYKKTLLQREQSTARLNNKEIEIFIKRQLYDAGKVDITELNNALMEKSSEQKTQALLSYNTADLRLEMAKISDIDPDAFTSAVFRMIPKEEYLRLHWDIRSADAQSKTQENLYGVTKSSYLPRVALNGDIGYRNYNPTELTGDYEGNFYSGGISMTLPLTYNASAAIQEARSIYLERSAAAADKRREAIYSYEQIEERIKSYRTYISIISENISLYDELIRVTQAGVTAGTKTGYDLKTLQNSQTIEKLEVAINEINIQIDLAKLYFSLSKEPL